MLSITAQTPVYCPGDSRVHRTALEELSRALQVAPAEKLTVMRTTEAPAGSIHLALLGESPVCQELASSGLVNLRNRVPTLEFTTLR
jgi:hypothetical protein